MQTEKLLRHEMLARTLVLLMLLAAIAIPAVGWWKRSQGIVLHARMAENGGWTPANLSIQAGEPLHLRLTSDDVLHSFAVGQSDLAPLDVIPGEMTEVTLLFDKPGKYTYYCTRWCSLNHWRMRGVIEVTGPVSGTAAVEPPLYVRLGLDLDAGRRAEFTPQQTPSAQRGRLLNQIAPQAFTGREYYRAHTPQDLWSALRAMEAYQGLTDQELWDLAAWIWSSHTSPEELLEGEQLYRTNCAACHGETGKGDGVFAGQLAGADTGEHSAMQPGEMTTRPADFSDPQRMLAASPALLQGKILRGGMGTGMPYFGPLFTEKQTWALVAYLWTFQFDFSEKP